MILKRVYPDADDQLRIGINECGQDSYGQWWICLQGLRRQLGEYRIREEGHDTIRIVCESWTESD